MVRGTVSDALGGVPTVPSQGMSPQDVELSQYDHAAAADSVAGPSMQLRSVCVINLFDHVEEQGSWAALSCAVIQVSASRSCWNVT